MVTNKHKSTKKVVVSILEHTTQQCAIERKTDNQRKLKDNFSYISCLSWFENIRVPWCSFVVPNLSAFFVHSVVKNGGAK